MNETRVFCVITQGFVGVIDRVINFFFYYIVGFCLSLRYRFTVSGLKELEVDKNKGTLFLSNHVATVDPVILEYILWKKFHPHPLAMEALFRSPFVRWVLNRVKTISVPKVTCGLGRQENGRKVAQYYDRVLAALQEKGAVLLYPSGGLTKTGKENLKSCSTSHVILQRVIGGCNVVCIRTRGLWGSSFSRYGKSGTPPLGESFKNAFKALLRKGIFFLPKREVRIFLEKMDYEQLKSLTDKKDLNRFLEDWFNQDPEIETITPYH